MTTQIDTNLGLNPATEAAILTAAIHFKRAGDLDLFEQLLAKGKALEEASKTVSCLRCVHACTQLKIIEKNQKSNIDFAIVGCALMQPIVDPETESISFFACSMESQTQTVDSGEEQ